MADSSETVPVENLEVDDETQVIIVHGGQHLDLGKTAHHIAHSPHIITDGDTDTSLVRDTIGEQWTNVANEQIIVETPIDGDSEVSVVTSPIIEVQTSEVSGPLRDDGLGKNSDDVHIDMRSPKPTVKVKIVATQHTDDDTTTNLIDGIEVLDTGSHFEAWNADASEGATGDDHLLGFENQTGQLIFIAQQPDTNTTSTQTELGMRAATKRERDRIKKRELRRCPEFREREKERAKARMRAKREDPEYRRTEREKDRKRRRLSRQRISLIRNMEKEREKQWKRIVRSVTATGELTEIDITGDT
ncbi:uncharacterized protein LOC144444719 isoform X2 [Glandiceps talaboti]